MPIVATARRGSAKLAVLGPVLLALLYQPRAPFLIHLDLKGRINKGLVKAKAFGKLQDRGRWVELCHLIAAGNWDGIPHHKGQAVKPSLRCCILKLLLLLLLWLPLLQLHPALCRQREHALVVMVGALLRLLLHLRWGLRQRLLPLLRHLLLLLLLLLGRLLLLPGRRPLHLLQPLLLPLGRLLLLGLLLGPLWLIVLRLLHLLQKLLLLKFLLRLLLLGALGPTAPNRNRLGRPRPHLGVGRLPQRRVAPLLLL